MTDLNNTHHISQKHKNSEEWWAEKSLPEKIALGFCFGILGLGLFALFGWITMLLWNWLMPYLFNLKTVNYWQAWGILLLSSLLFKRMGQGGHMNPSDRKRKQKLRRFMHDEEPEDTILSDKV